MDPKELQEKIERRYIQILLEHLKSKNIPQVDIRASAQALLALEPISDFQDANSKVDFLVEKFPIFFSLKDYITALENELETKDIVDKMHKHLKANDIDEALALVN